jgi:hypothetical protein
VNGSAQGVSGAQTSGLTDAQEIAAATTAALNNSGQAPLEASPSNPAPEAVAVTGISRENDFDAVSQLRDIEADAARRTANQGRFEQVAPTALAHAGRRVRAEHCAVCAADHQRAGREPLYPSRHCPLRLKMPAIVPSIYPMIWPSRNFWS